MANGPWRSITIWHGGGLINPGLVRVHYFSKANFLFEQPSPNRPPRKPPSSVPEAVVYRAQSADRFQSPELWAG